MPSAWAGVLRLRGFRVSGFLGVSYLGLVGLRVLATIITRLDLSQMSLRDDFCSHPTETRINTNVNPKPSIRKTDALNSQPPILLGAPHENNYKS